MYGVIAKISEFQKLHLAKEMAQQSGLHGISLQVTH